LEGIPRKKRTGKLSDKGKCCKTLPDAAESDARDQGQGGETKKRASGREKERKMI